MKIIKTVILSIICVLFTNVTKSQGIEFFHGTFEEALKVAQKENKPLFVDCYTSWCGPCKLLSKEIFTLKEVGDYFNQNFVCLKLQLDSKEFNCKEFIDKYKISCFPTLLWLDGFGNILHVATGFKQGNLLIDDAKMVFNEEERLGTIFKSWENGDRSLKVAKGYFAFDRNSKGEFDTYFDSLPEDQKISKPILELVAYVDLNLTGPTLEYLVKHISDYCKITESWNVNRAIEQRIQRNIIYSYGREGFDDLVSVYKKWEFPNLDLIIKEAKWKYFLKNKKYSEFYNSVKEYVEFCSKIQVSPYFGLITAMFDSSNNESFMKNDGRYITKEWVKEIEIEKFNYNIIAKAYYLCDDYENSIKYIEKGLVELKDEKGPYYEYLREELRQIKDMIQNKISK